MCAAPRPSPDAYDTNAQIPPHFAATPALTALDHEHPYSNHAASIRSECSALYRIHNLPRPQYYGLYHAGTRRELQDLDRDRTVVMVLELAAMDIYRGRWRDLESEARAMLWRWRLDGRVGVCLRFYRSRTPSTISSSSGRMGEREAVYEAAPVNPALSQRPRPPPVRQVRVPDGHPRVRHDTPPRVEHNYGSDVDFGVGEMWEISMAEYSSEMARTPAHSRPDVDISRVQQAHRRAQRDYGSDVDFGIGETRLTTTAELTDSEASETDIDDLPPVEPARVPIFPPPIEPIAPWDYPSEHPSSSSARPQLIPDTGSDSDSDAPDEAPTPQPEPGVAEPVIRDLPDASTPLAPWQVITAPRAPVAPARPRSVPSVPADVISLDSPWIAPYWGPLADDPALVIPGRVRRAWGEGVADDGGERVPLLPSSDVRTSGDRGRIDSATAEAEHHSEDEEVGLEDEVTRRREGLEDHHRFQGRAGGVFAPGRRPGVPPAAVKLA